MAVNYASYIKDLKKGNTNVRPSNNLNINEMYGNSLQKTTKCYP